MTKKLTTIGLAILVCPAFAFAQNAEKKPKASASGSSSTQASATAGNQQLQLEQNTTFEAALTKRVDAKKNKPGDPVEARTTGDVKSDGHVVIPKGSRLIGHVTDAKPRAKGQTESQLGLVFDKVVMKDGSEHPLALVIQAVAASEASAAMAQSNSPDPMIAQPAARPSAPGGANSGGGLVGGVTSTAGAAVGGVAGATAGVGSTAGAALGSANGNSANLAGALSHNTQGVVGLQGIQMLSQTESSTVAQGSLLTSKTQDVRLDSGTRFLLRAGK